MATEQTRYLVDTLAVLLQVAGAVLILVLLAILHRRRRAAHSGWWAAAWLLLTVAVLATSTRALMIPLALDVAPSREYLPVRVLGSIYQLAKIGALLLFLHGAVTYAERGLGRGWLSVIGAFAVIGALPVLAGGSVDALVRLQAPLAALTLGLSGVTLLRIPSARRGVGTRVTGIAFVAGALLWIVYGLVSSVGPMAVASNVQAVAGGIVRYSRFADFFFTIALGIGMVVLVLEDALAEVAAAKNRVDAANRELAAAHEELRQIATTDALTGCLNREGLQEWLDLPPSGSDGPGAVLVLDMDNLKPVNDAHGHAAGDSMLRQLATVLRDMAGPAAPLCRWGGDEFLLILPGLPVEEAEARCRQALEEAPPIILHGTPVILTLEASMGAAGYDGADNVAAAIRRADSVMYRQKQKRKLQSGGQGATFEVSSGVHSEL